MKIYSKHHRPGRSTKNKLRRREPYDRWINDLFDGRDSVVQCKRCGRRVPPGATRCSCGARSSSFNLIPRR